MDDWEYYVDDDDEWEEGAESELLHYTESDDEWVEESEDDEFNGWLGPFPPPRMPTQDDPYWYRQDMEVLLTQEDDRRFFEVVDEFESVTGRSYWDDPEGNDEVDEPEDEWTSPPRSPLKLRIELYSENQVLLGIQNLHLGEVLDTELPSTALANLSFFLMEAYHAFQTRELMAQWPDLAYGKWLENVQNDTSAPTAGEAMPELDVDFETLFS
jgi:hypothetical protein